MADENEIKKIENGETLPTDQGAEAPKELLALPEKKENQLSENQLIKEQLEREATVMKLDDALKQQAENEIKTIGYLGEEQKIKRLLDMARERGVVFAIRLAKDMNDPYILDTFHDLLIKEGYYQKFIK